MVNKKLQEKLAALSGTSEAAKRVLGDFENLSELQKKFPTAPDGAMATVSDTGAFYTFDQETATWNAITGGSGMSDLVDDTTPQLGGDLDLNSNDITGTGNVNITGTITASNNFISNHLSTNSITVTGSISVGGAVDGRDVAADGTKLDTIESNADVTDEANVLASLSGATTTAITPAAGDKILALDASDSDNIKHILFSDFAGSSDATSLQGEPISATTPTGGQVLAYVSSQWQPTTLGLTNDHGGLTGLGDDDHTQYSIISFDAGAPGSAPPRVGAIYIDTANDVAYIAVDTSASTDWQEQVVVDGTDLADGEILIWDAGNSKFVRDNREVVTTAVTTINMNSMMGSYYGTTTACTASSYTLANAKAGGRATIRIQESTSGGPAIAGTGITVVRKGDWSTNYDTTNVNTIYIEMVTATLAWCWITAVD